MQVINSDLIRGNIDTIILKTMENGDMYGLDIIREVENKSNGTYELKQPTLYSCLKRLENQELISSYWLDSDIGGKRHYYKLTEKGRDIVKSKQEEWSISKLLIDNLLGDFDSSEYRLVKKDDYEKIINGKPVIQYVNNNDSNVNDFLTNFNNQKNQETKATSSAEQIGSFFDDDYIPSKANDFNSNQRQDKFFSPADDDFFESSMNLSEVNDKTIDDLFNDEENLKTNKPILQESVDEKNSKDDSSKPASSDYNSNELIVFKKSTEKNKSTSITSSPLSTQSYKQRDLFDFARENQIQIDEYEAKKNSANPESSKTIFTKASNYISSSEIEGSIREFKNNISSLSKINSNDNFVSENFDEKLSDKCSEELSLSQTTTSETQKTESENLEISSAVQSISGANYHTKLKDNKLLSELSNLFNNEYANRNISFENDDGYYHSKDSKEKKENVSAEVVNQNLSANNEFSVTANLSENVKNNAIFEEKAPEINQNITQNAVFDDGIIIRDEEKIIDKKYDAQFAPKDSIDEIIYKNISDYSAQNPQEFIENTLSRYRQQDENVYKQKINNLSEYSKDSCEDDYEIGYTRDFQSLVDDYKKQGILVKEFNKASNLKNDKKYVMINKLKFVKSLILLFCYSFLLSALFIIMDSTSLKDMYEFSFKYFMYGLAPFVLYFFWSVLIYVLNPYKKVPANSSMKFFIGLSIFATMQLLTITIIFNWQMGFNSFTQVGYNHLLWIIPTIISCAPLISTFIQYGLLNSKNFNT